MPKPKKSLIRRLQIMWWALHVTSLWKGTDDEFDLATFALLLGPGRGRRERFLYHARNMGQDLRFSDFNVVIEDVVRAAATLPGLEGSDKQFFSPIFLLGTNDAWNYDAIVCEIDKILGGAGLARMCGYETFEEISTFFDDCDRNYVEEPYSHIAEDWYVARIDAVQDELPPLKWLEFVVLLFREANLAGEFDRARELRERTYDSVMTIVDDVFSSLSANAGEHRSVLKSELFADEFPFAGFRSQIEARRLFVGGIVLRPREIQERREVRALRASRPRVARRLYEEYCDGWEEIVGSARSATSRRGFVRPSLFVSPANLAAISQEMN
jgi:hypothetical protein